MGRRGDNLSEDIQRVWRKQATEIEKTHTTELNQEGVRNFSKF